MHQRWMTPQIDGGVEFLPSGNDPLPSHRLRQWKRRLEVDGRLAIKSEAAVKGGIPIDQDSWLMAAHGMADGVMHQFGAKPLALMSRRYCKGSKNPTHRLAVLVCDAAEAEMANHGLLKRCDHPVQC